MGKGMTVQQAQLATKPPITAFVSSGTRTTDERVRTIEYATPETWSKSEGLNLLWTCSKHYTGVVDRAAVNIKGK